MKQLQVNNLIASLSHQVYIFPDSFFKLDLLDIENSMFLDFHNS